MKTRNFILIGLTILLWFSFRFLLPLTLPFVLAYFFAKLVSPMIQFLVNKLKWRRKVSIFLVVFFTLLILGGFSAYIITLIISQGMLLLQKIPVYGQICGRMLEKMCSHCDRMLELSDSFFASVKKFLLIKVCKQQVQDIKSHASYSDSQKSPVLHKQNKKGFPL